MTWPTAPVRRVARFAYGESLPEEAREEGEFLVYGSNGPVGLHSRANTSAPVIVVGRKGSFGKVQYSERAVFAIDTTYFVDQTTTTSDLRWLFYALSTVGLDRLSEDVGVPGLSREKAYSQRVSVPPLPDQRAIVDFLDAETDRLDELIAKKRRMIELISELVSSQIDRLTAEGPDRRVRTVTNLITSGPRGWADLVGDNGELFIRSGSLQRNSLLLRKSGHARITAPSSKEADRSRVHPGDTIVGITGANTGLIGHVTPEEGLAYVSQHVAVLRPAGIIPLWLSYSLLARRAQEQLLAGQYGGTKQQLGLDDLADLVVSVPDGNRQAELLETLGRTMARGRDLSENLELQIGLLQEHRQSLITAALNGQMEILAA